MIVVFTLVLGVGWIATERGSRFSRAAIEDALPRTSHVRVRSGGAGEPLITDHGVTLTLTDRGVGVGVSMNHLPTVSGAAPGSVRLAGSGVAFLDGPFPGGSVLDERTVPMQGGPFVGARETLYWRGASYDFEGLDASALAVARPVLFYDLEFEIDGDGFTRPDSTTRLYIPVPESGVEGLFELKPWQR